MTATIPATDWLAENEAYVVGSYARWPVALDHGDGSWVWDVNGKRYLDFASGIAVNALGHNHPAITRTLAAQAKRLIHCSNLFVIPEQVALAKLLSEATGYEQAFFCNSGAEANEAAIKLARRWAQVVQGRPERGEVITFEGSFHGRTLATITATAQAKYQQGFAPLPGGFVHATFNDLASVRAAITDRTCAILVEPIQGEGGVRPATPAFLAGLRQLCDEHGLVLIFDEVQTGVGRTGTFLAAEQAGVRPDVVSLAKGLGGGVPIGAILIGERVRGTLTPGTHASTFGGNPLCAAVSHAVVSTILAPGFLQAVAAGGDVLRGELQALARQSPLITAVRGQGYLQGVRLSESLAAADVATRCREAGLLLVTAGDNLLRFLPPLTVSRDELRHGVAILTDVLRSQA